MRRSWIIMPLIVIWTALTIAAVTWGFTFNWPDYVHVDYGYPLVWATHTLVTIAGPVDKWNVNLSALVTDLIFWLGLMTIAVALTSYIFDRKASQQRKNPANTLKG